MQVSQLQLSQDSSFNRYMVECEYWQKRPASMSERVLIDTWWNVNTKFVIYTVPQSRVLIDTWWNVNTLST